MLHPRTGRVQSASAVYGRTRRHFLDPSIKRDFQYLNSLKQGDVGIGGRSLDDRVWLIVFQNGGPLRYYIYDRPARRARFLFTEQSELEAFTLARRQAVVVPTRDGLKLPGDLYLPSWTRPRPRSGRQRIAPGEALRAWGHKLPLIIRAREAGDRVFARI